MKVHRNYRYIHSLNQFKDRRFPVLIQNFVISVVSVGNFSCRKYPKAATFFQMLHSCTHTIQATESFFTAFKRVYRNYIRAHRLNFRQQKIPHNFEIRSDFRNNLSHQDSVQCPSGWLDTSIKGPCFRYFSQIFSKHQIFYIQFIQIRFKKSFPSLSFNLSYSLFSLLIWTIFIIVDATGFFRNPILSSPTALIRSSLLTKLILFISLPFAMYWQQAAPLIHFCLCKTSQHHSCWHFLL